jgi:tRNA A37 threonylcarbamoyltransferase TsaD
MNVGKILTITLGRLHKKEIIPVDHITAHYFSLFTQRKDVETQKFPILFISASGSHNSIVLMKSWSDFEILNDATHYDSITGKYIGIGSIYYKLVKNLGIL